MITFSKLGAFGQLGNQMFQYALLIGVSARTGYEIKIPKRYKGIKKKNLVELEPFSVSAIALWLKDRRQIKNVFRYEDLTFNPAVFEQPDFTDYQGYFQSEKYFAHAAERVRSEFRFQPAIEDYARRCAAERRGPGRLVAVHVRRGDYLQHPANFRVLTQAYLERAMHHEQLDPQRDRYLIFSDDHAWCERHLVGPNCSICRSPDHWHDLAIMTYCDAYIISASSFSWWGAWLSHTPDPLVLAPWPWFPPGVPIGTADVVPERWFKLTDP